MVILTIVASVVINGWLTHAAIHTANHRWCATLDLLTAHAPPKHSDQYRFYSKLEDLKHEFGCTER